MKRPSGTQSYDEAPHSSSRQQILHCDHGRCTIDLLVGLAKAMHDDNKKMKNFMVHKLGVTVNRYEKQGYRVLYPIIVWLSQINN